MNKKPKGIIRRELLKLAKAHGGMLTPEAVVTAAKSKHHPLHSNFEWDDTEAAMKYRLDQARQLIRVVVEVHDKVAGPTRVFVSLSSDRKEGEGYRVVAMVLSSEELRDQMLQDALQELEVFKIKYRKLKELASVFEAINLIAK